MAVNFFAGIGQTIAGGIATAATLGQVEAVNDWTVKGAMMVGDNAEKAWGPDGEITKFAESVPGVGYIAAAGHGIAGDDERAKRATAKSTKTTLVVVGGVAGAVGGPAGIVAGAALGSAAGQCAEIGINHAIDEEFQTDAGTYDNFDAKNFVGEVIVDGALGAVGVGVSGVGKQAARHVVGPTMKEGGKVVVKNTGRYVTKRAVEKGVNLVATTAAKPGIKRNLR